MKKEYLILGGLTLLLLLILGTTIGPFMATGVPGILVRGTSPDKGVGPNSAVSWTDSWSQTVSRFEGSWTGSWAQGDIMLTVDRKIDIEVTPIKWVTQDKPFNALFNTTADKQEGYNMTVYPNRYGFGIRYSLHYVVDVVWRETSSGFVNPFAPSVQSRREDVVKHALDYLISQYNTQCYLSSQNVYFSVDAPTLGADQRYALNPDYIGVMDAYLMNIEYAEPTKGWAGAFVPKDTTTPLDMYASISDIQAGATPLWHASTPTLLKPDEIYWFQKYAPAVAYFKTTILTFGTQLVLDTSKAFPEYWNLQFLREGGSDPRATQWFRVDLGFKTSKIYDITGIELPESIKEQIIHVVIPTTPNAYPYPTPPTPQPTSWLDFLGPILTAIVIIIVAVIILLIVYIIVKAKKEKGG